jgi:uncharacterized membrane protein YecN with MAPEG domain
MLHPLTTIVLCLALGVYFVMLVNVGRARVRHKVPAPAIGGNEAFERVFRVQQNTLENLVLFIPGLWLFSDYLSPVWASALGVVWIIGRILYARGYARDAARRGPGFMVSLLATVVLVGGALIGALIALLAGPL